ncbi:hypothetical protein AB1Y20_002150 [Prymnesium parvum]|uniref:MARVEL domain-containing protein n=1 Tax=Prymnesium parvum TaxID=97485 RepID=A0AB34J739_PRYPA
MLRSIWTSGVSSIFRRISTNFRVRKMRCAADAVDTRVRSATTDGVVSRANLGTTDGKPGHGHHGLHGLHGPVLTLSAFGWPRDVPTPSSDHRRDMLLELMMALVIAACVASAWRGAWWILDFQFLTYHPTWSAAASFLIGGAMLFCLAALQLLLAARAHERETRWWWVADLLFSYAGFWCSVFVWRGIWQLWDHALGEEYGFPLLPAPTSDKIAAGAWLSHGVGVFILVCLDSLRALNAPPMMIVFDSEMPLFGARTTPGLHGLTGLARFKRLPQKMDEVAWRAALGLPQVPPKVQVPMQVATFAAKLKQRARVGGDANRMGPGSTDREYA